MVIGDMWIFRRHRHLKPELLSEYLDGRLGSTAHLRFSRQVDTCQFCRDELDSLRSTVALLRELPELTPPRSFTLTAAPVTEPLVPRPPLPLRAPGWTYAGAASLAGLALAVMVSADTLGLLAPNGQAAFSAQSSDQNAGQNAGGSDQTLESAAAPEAGSAAATATSQSPIASSEPNDAAPPEPSAALGADSNQTLRSGESLPDPADAGPELAQPPAAPEADTMALAVEPEPGASDEAGESGTAGLPDSAIDGDAFSEKAADTSEGETNRSTEGPTGDDPGSGAVLTPGQYRDTPLIWRVLEGIATALLLTMLSILAVRRLRSRRTGR
jgi:hypothetical protein